MKKITLMIAVSLLSFCTYGQLALESFESAWTGTPTAPPDGWAVYNEAGNNTWVRSPLGNTSIPPHQGSYAAYLQRDNVPPGAPIPTNWLITKQFNSPNNGLLHFFSRLTFPGDYGGIYKIKIAVITDASVPVTDLPWVDLVPPMGEFDINPSQLEYAEKTFNIPASYIGQQVRIAFIMVGDDADRWIIDDVEVVSQCSAPSVLKASNITLTTADLSWTNPAAVTSWEIEVVSDQDAPTGTGITYSGALPYHKTGLTSDSSYKYYVRSACTDGGKSAWIGPFFFTTPAIGETCGAPLIIPSALPYTTTNNTTNFADNYEGAPGTGCGTTSSYLSGNDVVYAYTPIANGTINISLSNTGGAAGVFVYADCTSIGTNCLAGVLSSATVPGVIPTFAVTANTTYYIVVSSLVLVTPYTLTIQQVYCAAPTGLTVSALAPTSANISWAAGTATAWQIAVQPAGTGLPMGPGINVTQNTNVPVTSTSTGAQLTQATSYEYYVRANCGDGTYSIWTGPVAFTTTQVPVNLGYTENFDGPTAHGWSILNGTQTNKWYVGSATYKSPANSLYISGDNNVTNNYSLTATSTVHAYRDIQLPAGVGNISLSFDLKAGGEGANDYVRAWLVPVTFVPTPGTQITATNGVPIGGNFNMAPDWTTQNAIVNASAFGGTVRRIVFEWRNNSSLGLEPGAAIDNVAINAVTCLPPAALTLNTVTQNSATYSWTPAAGSTPTGYEYYYSQNTVPPTDATTALGSVTAPATTATIGSLNASETYYVWVRSVCGGTKSFWTGPVSATLTQVPETLTYVQNFDGGASGFSTVNQPSGNGWFVGPATGNSSSKSLYISSDNGVTNSYISNGATVVHAYRDITIPAGAAEIRVTFDYKLNGDSNDYLRAWMIPGTTTPALGTAMAAAVDRVQLGGNYTAAAAWTTVSYDIPVTSYQGQIRRLLFEWRNNTSLETLPPAAIDNINISVLACPKPTNLTVINVSSANATLDWTEPALATNWEVAYMPAIGAATPTAPGIAVTASEYTPPSGTFIPTTQYVYYVRANCGGTNGMSQWAGPFTFALKPANDECAQATVVLTNPDKICTNYITGNITGATGSAEPTTCSGTKDDDIWFEFVATNTSHIITLSNLTGSTTDVWHALYSGNNCATITQLYCSNPLSSFAQNLVVGQTYKIRVWTFTSAPNQNTNFQLCITTPPPPPANDECANATALIVNPDLLCGASVAGTVESATASAQTSTCTGVADDDVWFTFTATNITHKINLINMVGAASLNFVLYSGNCGALTQLYCNPVNQTELWANNLTVGQTYYLKIYSFTSIPGQNTAFRVCVGTPAPAPLNDNCGTATVVGVNPTLECDVNAHGAIQSATPSPEANACSNVNDDDDIWFEFTATGTSHIIDLRNFTANGAGIVSNVTNLYHVLYSGTDCTALTQIYCSAANNSFAQNLTIGQVYKVRVYSETPAGNQECEFDICITTPPVVPANDNCDTATVIPVNLDAYCNVHASGSVVSATASANSNTCTGTADDDVWFEFTATNTSHLIYLNKIMGSTAGLYHSVYSGDCSSLTLLYCSTSLQSAYSNFVVGNTYKIRVYTSVATINQTTQFDICIRVPNTPISVSDNAFTPEQLVTQVLFDTPCATVSNVSSISGLTYGSVPSIGYFDASGASFPFSYGVVLATGDVNLSEGPYTYNGANNPDAWLGDDDLNNIVLENNPTHSNGLHNATALEFDFVPLINKFEFEFLFASAEYGNFQCNFGDAFAFILTDQNGNSQNLAVLPDTNIPVSVTNIRDEQYNSSCGSDNIEYFGQYNAGQPLASAINYDGQTQALMASANVIPGQTYHIKLVIADYSDTFFSSAVFLGGGSFNIGTVDLGTDLLIATNTALCENETKVINSQLPADQYTFEWFKNGVTIADATQPSYEAAESGNYGLQASVIGLDCSFEGSIRIEYYSPVNGLTGNPVNLTQCDATGFHSFDLTSNIDAINALPTEPENFVSTIYLSEQDAIDGTNPIDPAAYANFTNTVANLQTLWIKTVYNVTTCTGIKSFDLVVQDLTPQYTIDNDFSICAGTSDTIDVVITDTDTNPVTYTWTKDGITLADTTPSITVTETGAYTVVLDRTGCSTSSTVNVVVTPIPVADAPADIITCGSYELPDLSADNSYYNAATGNPVAVHTVITETTTFNVVASSGTTPECTSQSSFTVTINNGVAIPAIEDVIACDTYVLPVLALGNYFTEANGGGTMLSEGDEITNSQIVYVYAETVPNCTSEISFAVTITPSPVADEPADVYACDSYKLPALSKGNNYYAEQGGTGTAIEAGSVITATQLIYVYAQNGNCFDEKAFMVNINPSPIFNLGGPYVSCIASDIIINAEGSNFNDTDATYAWTLNNIPVTGGSSITGSGFGTYTLTVTVNGCTHTESVEVIQDELAIALTITDGCEEGQYMLGVTDDNGSFNTDTAIYAWAGPDNFTSTAREFSPLLKGEYVITVTTPDGCIGEGSFIVTDTNCDIQRGISPNNDGLNDAFELSQLDVKKLEIFNRYGQEVYAQNDYKNEWKGQTNKGDELPTGTYFYRIEFRNGEAKTGWIYINRGD